MDDLFEQILSVPPWLDRAGISRTAWEASAMSASSNIFGSLGIQRMPPGHSAGDVDNQAPLQDCHGGVVMGEGAQMTSNKIAVLPQHSCAHKIPLLPTNNKSILQTGPSATASPTESAAFTTSNGFEGQQLPHSRQSPPGMLPTWRQPFASNGTLMSPALVQGKPDPFSSVGGIPNDLHPGKRQREDEDMMHDIQAHGTNNGEQPISLVQNPLGSARPRIRARRGQATDPHSIAERNRRERIAERMKALQELVPDSNKTDKASMLDEIIGYVKFLQMQVKCLSMCRLGGAGAGAPLLADLPAEGAASFIAANLVQATGASNDGIALAEQQVARLMDEDMSAAMQYLQSKGLCLMPISLATAISSSGGASKHHSSPLKCPGTGGTERPPTDVVSGMAKATSSTSLSGNGDLDRTNEVGPGPSVTGDLAMPVLLKSEDPYR